MARNAFSSRRRAATATVLAVTGTALVGLAAVRQLSDSPRPPAVIAGTSAPATQWAPPIGSPGPSGRPARRAAPPHARSLSRSRPARVEIPRLRVDTSDLVDLGLARDNTMQVPDGPDPVGWYTESPTPGETGPSVLAGHVTWNGARGVFFELAAMRPGDVVRVGRADGSTVTFRVARVEQYPKDAFPTLEVYGNTDGPQLRLITCAGDYDERRSRYLDNVVVYARMVDSSSG